MEINCFRCCFQKIAVKGVVMLCWFRQSVNRNRKNTIHAFEQICGCAIKNNWCLLKNKYKKSFKEESKMEEPDNPETACPWPCLSPDTFWQLSDFSWGSHPGGLFYFKTIPRLRYGNSHRTSFAKSLWWALKNFSFELSKYFFSQPVSPAKQKVFPTREVRVGFSRGLWFIFRLLLFLSGDTLPLFIFFNPKLFFEFCTDNMIKAFHLQSPFLLRKIWQEMIDLFRNF